MIRTTILNLILVLFLALLLAACGQVNRPIEIADGATVDENLSTVNGAVRVGANATVNGDAKTVNGSIRLGPGSRAGKLETVNGSVDLGENSTAAAAETVNGAIRLAAGAAIEGSVSTVNGQVELSPGARVGERISAVNGRLHLDNAEAGSLVNYNGGMRLDNGARVLGELRVRRPNRPPSTPPVIRIGAGAEVVGPLHFEQPVDLFVHETAVIGEVIGAEPQVYSDSE